MSLNSPGTQLTASDTVSFRPLRPGTRVLPFDLFRSLRVGSVRDERGRELDFVQEGKDEDADFAVLLPDAPEVGKTYRVTVQYAGGDAIRDSGGGNFYLLPRSTWSPNAANSGAFGDRAAFRITFRYPKETTFVGTGRLAEPDKIEGDMKLTQSGVSDNFAMLVPVWVDYGKGWTRLGAATVVGNSSVDLANVPLAAPPKRVAICALNDVLATSIQNNRR